MEPEHPACPHCGYDLHGIPEIRCPECGFGFDKAALRDLAEMAEYCRLAAARTVVVRTALALVLGMPFLCRVGGLHGSALLALLGITYLAAFVVWVWCQDVGPHALPYLPVWLVGFAFVLTVLDMLLPRVAVAGKIIVLAWAWWARLRGWPALYDRRNSPSAAFRKTVQRHSLIASSVLVGATVVALIGWAAR